MGAARFMVPIDMVLIGFKIVGTHISSIVHTQMQAI